MVPISLSELTRVSCGCRRLVLHGLLPRHLLRLHRSGPVPLGPLRAVSESVTDRGAGVARRAVLPLIVCANGAIRWLFSRATRVECDCSLVGVSICRADGRHHRVDGGAELEAAANLSGRCVADHHGRKCGRIPDTVGDSSGFRV